MRTTLQSILLCAYRKLGGPRWLDHPLGRRVLMSAYVLYKRWFEAAQVRGLHEFVAADAWVVDVGANVGYFTRLFAGWVSGSGKVVAIEPDTSNLAVLRWHTGACADRTVIVAAAAAAFTGPAGLQRSADSHADHRLVAAGDGEPVAALRLDELLERYGPPPVGLVKIDVQGTEYGVLAGALHTLDRCRPAVILEVDAHDVPAMVQSARALELLHRLGYRCRGELGHTDGVAWTPLAILAHARERGYGDYLFLPDARRLTAASSC
ncbi:MAG: FkbM family methyltransferase [Gammaproteobacteria bacterium]